MSYLTTVRIYKGILIWSGVIILMTAVLDLKLQSTHSFWQDHSFTTNIACGILLLLLGFFGVEAWFREHEAHRWQQVANVSCKELGYSCDVLNNGVEHLLTGYFRSKHGVFLSDEIERNIERH